MIIRTLFFGGGCAGEGVLRKRLLVPLAPVLTAHTLVMAGVKCECGLWSVDYIEHCQGMK